jgi:hypothetical protein
MNVPPTLWRAAAILVMVGGVYRVKARNRVSQRVVDYLHRHTGWERLQTREQIERGIPTTHVLQGIALVILFTWWALQDSNL